MKNKKDICFVLLPGFSPDSFPVAGIKKSLNSLGYDAVVSNFYGQKEINNFSLLTMDEAIENISQIINSISDQYSRVFGIGISLGGALFIEHAKNYANLDGIVSVGTPFCLRKKKLIAVGQFFFPLIYFFWKRLQKIKKLRLLPLGASDQVIRYLEGGFLKNLDTIDTPILFLHSRKDGVADYSALEKYVPKISSEKKEVIYFKNGNHVVNDNPELIVQHALNFFELTKN